MVDQTVLGRIGRPAASVVALGTFAGGKPDGAVAVFEDLVKVADQTGEAIETPPVPRLQDRIRRGDLQGVQRVCRGSGSGKGQREDGQDLPD